MVKTITILTIALLPLLGDQSENRQSSLENACLGCHREQKLPSDVIYRRYLLQYSSRETIKKKIFSYLKSPTKEASVMPPQFFEKYPIKEATQMNDMVLQEQIDAYVQFYDVSKKLFIKTEQN